MACFRLMVLLCALLLLLFAASLHADSHGVDPSTSAQVNQRAPYKTLYAGGSGGGYGRGWSEGPRGFGSGAGGTIAPRSFIGSAPEAENGAEKVQAAALMGVVVAEAAAAVVHKVVGQGLGLDTAEVVVAV
ncbi:hypothetical protein CRG98_027719 [Punica granatum]|uniref:Uncharacterized protein n=1 Tax=Punica granatum TaxID=22663 RepID=A0A2I0J868_PUNGR|nr:hypothetical protein CRG98_027719 [Punica granatum]